MKVRALVLAAAAGMALTGCAPSDSDLISSCQSGVQAAAAQEGMEAFDWLNDSNGLGVAVEPMETGYNVSGVAFWHGKSLQYHCHMSTSGEYRGVDFDY